MHGLVLNDLVFINGKWHPRLCEEINHFSVKLSVQEFETSLHDCLSLESFSTKYDHSSNYQVAAPAYDNLRPGIVLRKHLLLRPAFLPHPQKLAGNERGNFPGGPECVALSCISRQVSFSSCCLGSLAITREIIRRLHEFYLLVTRPTSLDCRHLVTFRPLILGCEKKRRGRNPSANCHSPKPQAPLDSD